MNSPKTPIHVVVISILSIVLMILALALPFKASKNKSYDAKTATDLQSINSGVTAYYKDNKKLPSSISDLDINDEVKGRATKRGYELKSGDDKKDSGSSYYSSSSRPSSRSYQLCATFRTDASKDKPSYASDSSDGYYDITYHKSGKQCFDLTAKGSSYDPYQYDDSTNNTEELKNDYLYNLGQ